MQRFTMLGALIAIPMLAALPRLAWLGASNIVHPMTDARASPAPISVLAEGRTVGSTDTLDAALRLVRDYRKSHDRAAIVVELAAGTYRITTPILIGPEESGTGSASLVIRGDRAGGTAIKGSVVLGPFATSSPIVDPTTVPGLATPVLSYGSYLEQTGATVPLVFDDGRRLAMPRWPQRGYATGWTIATRAEGMLISHPNFAAKTGASVLVVGYPTSDWAYEAIPGHVVAGGILLPGYRPAASLQARLRLAVANVAQTGSGHSIRIEDGGRLALSGMEQGSRAEIAVARELLVVERATNVTIEDIAFEHSVGNAVRVYASNGVTLRNCYIGGTGGKGVSVDGGTHVTIERCVVDDTGLSGITLFGGDRASLTGSGHVVRDSVVQRSSQRIRSYTPGVALLGVGNLLSRSTILALPHAAVGLSGNNNAVESNDIHAVACETGDVGAVYMGRDWTQRGNRVTENFLHDIGTADPSLGNSAVYLDDQFSGVAIARNVILRASQGVVIGGGRDNRITGNVFAAMLLSAIWMDQRGLGAQKAEAATGGELQRQLAASPYRSPLWRARYPSLATLLDDRPGAAIGNRAERNVVVGSPFLQTDPPGLPLDAGDNRRMPDRIAQGLKGISAARQYAVLRALLGGFVGTPPGPSAPLLYANRIVDAADCKDVER